MSITVDTQDVGRRVRAHDTKELGTIKRVLPEHGTVYVQWDYQQSQDAPYPTSEVLLDWAPEAPGHTDLMVTPESIDKFMEENPLPDEEPEEDDGVLAATAGLVEAEVAGLADIDTNDDSQPASEEEFQGSGGDFGGGGSSGSR